MKKFNMSWVQDDASFPAEIFDVKGMIGRGERKMLYSLARYGLEGFGQIVDAGAFIGSSCLCLASGLAAGASCDASFIHSFDLFVAEQIDVVDAIKRMVRPTKFGDRYLDIFLDQTRPYKDRINIYPGDLLSQCWAAKPIELLFVDICKSPELNACVTRQFITALIPGKSVLVHQDFLHVWHPYIHWTMEVLAPYFEIETSLIDSSRMYRLVSAIPDVEIERIINGGVSTEEKVFHLRRLGADSPDWLARLSEVLVLRQLAVDKSKVEFHAAWKDYQTKYRDKIQSQDPSDWIFGQGRLVYENTVSMGLC